MNGNDFKTALGLLVIALLWGLSASGRVAVSDSTIIAVASLFGVNLSIGGVKAYSISQLPTNSQATAQVTASGVESSTQHPSIDIIKKI